MLCQYSEQVTGAAEKCLSMIFATALKIGEALPPAFGTGLRRGELLIGSHQ